MAERNVILVDDHNMITTGLKTFIQSESHWNVVFTANSIKETLENLDKKFGENHTFQTGELFAIVDMRLGDDDGFELVKELNSRGIRCVMYSMFGAPSFVLKAMQVGAFGYVLKENDDRCIIQALESAFAGKQYLSYELIQRTSDAIRLFSFFTKREKDIFDAVLEGLEVDGISKKLKINKRTVENYLTQIYEKTGCPTRDEIRKKYADDMQTTQMYRGGAWQMPTLTTNKSRTLLRGITPPKIWVQIVIGLVFGTLNIFFTNFMTQTLKLPLFFDCILTVAASFLGTVSGVVSAFAYHSITLLVPINGTPPAVVNFCFIICSLTVVFSVRIFCRDKVDILRLVLLSLFLTIIISLEGGIIFSTVYADPETATTHPVDRKILSVIYQSVSQFIGVTLMRIPINLVDKTIAVVLGLGIALGAEKVVVTKSK